MPIVRAVLCRNLSSISRCASEKCQKETEDADALSEHGCISAADKLSWRESSIMLTMVEFMETSENGVKRNLGGDVVPRTAPESENG